MWNKFKAKKTEYGNRTYDSKLEAGFAVWLDSLVKEGKLKSVTPQHKISLDVNGKHIANHFVDFEVVMPSGEVKWVEAKGLPTQTWVMKRRLTEALYPGTPYLTNPSEKELLRRHGSY